MKRALLLAGVWFFAAPALAQTGPSFADGASVAEQIYQPGTAITTLTLPAATGGSGTLSYTLTPAGSIPSGLSFSASARTVTGTPAAGAVVASLTYTVTDAGGNTDTLPVTIVVRPEPTITLAASSVTNEPTNTYTVVLDAQPASDVTLAIRLAWNFVEPLPAGLQADKSSLVFTPSNWNTSQTVTLTFTEDLTAGSVFLNHDISIGGRMTHTSSTFYTVIVIPRIVVSSASLTINEGSSANYTVVWDFLQSRATARTLTVTPATSDATVATVSGPLTFIHGGPNSNWDTPQMVTVNAVAVGDADTRGGTATISHTQTGVSSVDFSRSMVAVSVVDSDSLRQLSVSVDDTTPEEGGEAVFTVALTGQAPVAMQPVTVDWAVSGAQTADYTVSGADTDGTLSFTGLGSQNVTLAITDDALSEGGEMLTFTLSNASRADILTATATATIGESDRPITVSFASVSSTVALTEGTGHRFRLSFPEDIDTTAAVEVDWRISFPAASQTVDPADAADFTSTTGTASIPAGDADGDSEFRITPLGDNLNEAIESFTITVSNVRGGGAIAAPSLSSSTMVSGTIAASDPVTVSIAGPTPPAATEGGSATFRISINNASEASVSVPWSVNELSDAGIVGATSGTVTFPARTTTLSQNVTISLAESETLGPLSPTETLTVTIGTVSGGRGTLSGSGAMASVTVSFTGGVRRFTITGPATIAETDSAVESRDYTITLSGQAFSANTAVTWTVTHGDTSDADFIAASDRSGMVTFGPDDGDGATRSFSITVAGDNESEPDEVFTVQASVADDTADDGTDFGRAASTTITDDDSRARVLTVTGPASIAENDDATNGVESGDYTITLTGAAFSTNTAVTWTVTHGDTADADFLAAGDRSGMVTFGTADGDGSTRTFSITVAGDQMNEGAESFSVQLSVPDATSDGGTGYGDPAFTTIADDETGEIVVYVGGNGAISEGGSTPLRARFRVDLNGQTASGDVVASYTIVPGSSAFTVDDIALSSLTGMQTLDVDHATTPVTTATLDITATDDSLNEGAESFTVTVTAAIGADSLRVVNNSGTFSIAASDFITAQLSSTTTLSEGADPAAAVTLTLDNTPTTEVTVDYTIGVDTDDATIDASAADYSGASGSATFAANTAPTAVTLLSITDDNLNEADERLTVTIRDDQVRGAIEGSGQNQMSTGASETYTISFSDEITVRISADAATVNEGASAQFTVSMSGASAGSAAPITVSYTVSGTTDTPTDVNGGRIEIAAGQTTGTITLGIPFSQTLDDDSPAETLSVTLGTVNVGAAGGEAEAAASPNNSASVTVNYLSAAHTISFTNPASSIVEGGSTTYTVARSGPAIAGAAGIVLSWAYAAGASNPASAADFAGGAAPAGGTLTFTGSQTSQTFTITTAEDALSEPGETFTLSLSATSAVLGSEGGVALPSALTVTIGESDRPVTLQIAAPGSDLTEGAAANFTVSFPESVTTTEPITVYWRNLPSDVSTDTARNQDFEAASLTGSTVIAAGQSSAVIAITPIADNHNEGPETFTVRITSIDSNPNQRGGAIAAPVIGSTNEAQATIAASDPLAVRLARRSGQTGAVVEGGDAEFTVRLALASDSSTSATSATGICVSFSTAIASQQNPPGAANTAGNADLEVRNCAGNVVSIAADGAATGGVLIPADQSSAAFGIRARFDDLDEGATGEMLTVTITSAAFQPTLSGATAPVIASTPTDAMVTVEIENINSARTLAIAAPAAPAEEGGDLVFAVTVEGEPVSEAFVVEWAVTTGAAELSSATSGRLNFGVSSQRTQMQAITLTTTDDSDSEPAETVTVTLTDPCPASGVCAIGGRSGIRGAQTPSLELIAVAANGAIGESDRPVALQVAAPGSALTEGTAANFTVSFAESVTTGAALVVSWRLDGLNAAGAASDGDFEAANLRGEVSIAPGQRSVNLPITATDDAVNEAAETFRVLLLSVRGGGAIAAPALHATPTANATIAASDPVTVRLARSGTGAVREGSDAEFTVSLALTAGGATATSGGNICAMFSTVVSQTTTLAAGENPNTAANPDIEVRGCGGNLATISATSQATGGVVIPAGQSSATLRIPVRFDDEDEGSAPETLRVALTSAAHTALSGASALTADTTTVMIMLQNVNALRTLSVSAAALTGDEDSASMPGGSEAFVDYTVGITGADLEEEVTANWTLAAANGANLFGAAASGSGLARNHGGDHTPDFGRAAVVQAGGGTVNTDGISGTLRFPAGAPTSRTVRVPLMQDALNEGAETLTLRVTDPCPATGVCTLGGGSTGGAPALQLSTGERTETIPASDPAMLRITRVGSGTVVSGEGVTYQVSLGNTFLNGQQVPVVASAPLMVMVPLQVGGTDSGQSFTVEVPTGQSSGQADVPDTVIAMALSGQTGTPMLSLGMASVTGAPGPSGSTAVVTPPDPADPADSANLPDPVQTAAWELSRSGGGAEAPEGGSYEITFTLRGSAVPTGGLRFDWSVTGSAATDGGAPAVAADFARAAGYTCGAAAVGATCTSLPGGTVSFTAGDTSQTIAIAVRDDSADNLNEGRTPDGMIRAEGFTLTFTALRGTDVGRVEYAAGLELPGTPLQVDIPALRADLTVANATAAEGASAVFQVALSNFVGGDATIQPVVVSYRVGVDAAGAALAGDTATLDADYTAAETSLTIPAGESSGAIAIPLVLDGVLEPRETFTLTITGATGGGGTIRLVPDATADPVVVANEISATGTITDDADQGARRRQRVGALVTVLDRQTALLATDAISARLSRARTDSAQSANLSIANRNLIGARSTARGGAADTGTAGVAGTEGEGFGGLGAGLAGAANMGTRTALPSLAQVLNGSSFRFGAASDVLAGLVDFADGIEVWGSGGYVDLRSESRSSGLTYDGESIAAFIGADAIVPQLPNLLAGLAVGWSAGDLDFTDRAGGFQMRGEFSNDALSVHPYFGWQLSPHANAWLVLGFGAGSVDIEENEGSGADAISRKLDGGDSAMLMFSTGITGTQQIGETGDLKLRFALTRVHSRVDSGSFDDGALLPKTRGRSLRFGGEAEAGRRITLENGLSLRPFGTLRLRLDNASAEAGVENAAMDWGAGITAAWTDLGLDGRFAFRRQLNDTGDEEQGVSLDVNFAPGATGQGIAISLQSALQQRRPGLSNLDGGLGDALLGANSALSNPLGGNAFGAGGASSASASAGMQHSLSGEIAYGVAVRYFGRGNASRAALLTPYGRFNLGSADTRWAAGLRLANPGGLQLGLEAGLDLNSATAAAAGGAPATPRSYDLLLTGRLRF